MKLGVGQHRGQWTPQIMRDGTGHASDGRQPLGMQQLLLRLMQAFAHPRECFGELRDLSCRGRLYGITKVAAAQRMHTIHQLLQRTSKCAGQDVHQQAAEEDCA